MNAGHAAASNRWAVKGILWRKRVFHHWRLFCQDRLALSGLAILGLFLALALIQAAWMAMGVPKIYDPIYGYDFSQAPFSPPNASHWLGTDSHGRDVLITVVLGTSMGVVAAYCAGGWLDALLMRDSMVHAAREDYVQLDVLYAYLWIRAFGTATLGSNLVSTK